MIFGIPVEIRNHENRVGITPKLAKMLIDEGHQVYIERGAGAKSMFDDLEYEAVGATVVPSPEKLYGHSEFILKVRAPKPVEYELIEPHHTVFAFFQFFNYLEMTRALMARGGNCFGYELLRVDQFSRPILDADRSIAGQLAVQQGAYYLQRQHGGRGSFVGHIASDGAANIVVIGASAAGLAAAAMGAGCGAQVTFLEVDENLLKIARSRLSSNIRFAILEREVLRTLFPVTDIVICAYQRVEMPKPPKISEEMVSWLPRGAVIIDLDIEYDGGAFATSHPTKIDNPIFIQHEVIHFCVPNLAGSVPRASSIAHSEALKPVLTRFLHQGFNETLKTDAAFRSGLAIFEGRAAHPLLAKAISVPYFDIVKDSE